MLTFKQFTLSRLLPLIIAVGKHFATSLTASLIYIFGERKNMYLYIIIL